MPLAIRKATEGCSCLCQQKGKCKALVWVNKTVRSKTVSPLFVGCFEKNVSTVKSDEFAKINCIST